MKKAAATFSMFILGVVVGFMLAPSMFLWFVSALGSSLVVSSPTESIIARGQFGLGLGVVFAASSIAAQSLRGVVIYLVVGLSVSSLAAACYHTMFAASATHAVAFGITSSEKQTTVVLLQALPALRIPLIGALAVLGCALVRHSLASRSRAA